LSLACGASVGCDVEDAELKLPPAELWFPVGGEVAVTVAPRSGATSLGTLDKGDYVRLRCSREASYVSPPAALASAGGNNSWNKARTRFGVGWIPDSYVDSGTHGSAASAC
jgi:hypothetical protein